MDISESFILILNWNNIGDFMGTNDEEFPTYQAAVEEGLNIANQNEKLLSFSIDKIFKITR